MTTTEGLVSFIALRISSSVLVRITFISVLFAKILTGKGLGRLLEFFGGIIIQSTLNFLNKDLSAYCAVSP